MKNDEVRKEQERAEQGYDSPYTRPQLIYIGRALELVKSGGNWIRDYNGGSGYPPTC